MVEATTRERISELVTSKEASELQRVEEKLSERLDELAGRRMYLSAKLNNRSLTTKNMLTMMEERDQLVEDFRVARESLVYLHSCRKRQEELFLRNQLQELDSAVDRPSLHRKELIEALLRDGDEVRMRDLLNALIDKRGQIIAHREILEGVLRHVPVTAFETVEAALELADDTLSGIDSDIPLLWRTLNRSL